MLRFRLTVLAVVAFSVLMLSGTGDAQLKDGTLVVTIRGVVRYTEGATTYFTIRSMGTVVSEFEFQISRDGSTHTLSLAPGDYEIETHVRARQPGRSGPPQDRCSGAFSLTTGQTVYVIRKQEQGPGEGGTCTVEISNNRPSPERRQERAVPMGLPQHLRDRGNISSNGS
jgi:hypothetical protein